MDIWYDKYNKYKNKYDDIYHLSLLLDLINPQDKYNYYNVNGTGFDFQKPILLNDLDNFANFKNFCGNFGIGFQNIDKHIFCLYLLLRTMS